VARSRRAGQVRWKLKTVAREGLQNDIPVTGGLNELQRPSESQKAA